MNRNERNRDNRKWINRILYYNVFRAYSTKHCYGREAKGVRRVMHEEGLSIKKWARGKLEGAMERAIKALERGVSEYEHGELMGAVSAYHNVLVELGPANAWKRKYNAFNVWVDEICEHSPLTVGEAIEIYNFCDRNDLLKRYNIVERVIELGLQGHTRSDIMNLLKLEALKKSCMISPRWEWKK